MLNSAWYLTFFDLIQDYLSESDYATMLKESWIMQENPNMDVNCPPKKSVKYFRKANKKLLMSKTEYLYYKNLPDEVTVYRGVAVGRVADGLSWTDNKDKAEWFAHRFDRNGEEGYLLEKKVSKKNILAYFNSRGEFEVVVDIYRKD